MRQSASEVSESSEDLAHGQVVIVTFRWILVLAGLLLAVWNPTQDITELYIQISVIFILACVNFYLFAQILIRRPVIDTVVYGASLADLAVISALVIVGGGFKSGMFIFYYPAILAFSVAFPRAVNFMFTGGVLAVYAGISILSAPTEANFQVVIARMSMMAAVSACGNWYWRTERNRGGPPRRPKRH